MRAHVSSQYRFRVRFSKLLILLPFLLAVQNVYADEATDLVKDFIQAFNKKDVNAMLELSSEEMQWMSISGQKINTETSSHSELREAMSSYFKNAPSAKSKLRSISESGPYVYTLEEATWLSGEDTKSQCSVAVYELKNKKIHHVWYFPAHQCP